MIPENRSQKLPDNMLFMMQISSFQKLGLKISMQIFIPIFNSPRKILQDDLKCIRIKAYFRGF